MQNTKTIRVPKYLQGLLDAYALKSGITPTQFLEIEILKLMAEEGTEIYKTIQEQREME